MTRVLPRNWGKGRSRAAARRRAKRAQGHFSGRCRSNLKAALDDLKVYIDRLSLLHLPKVTVRRA